MSRKLCIVCGGELGPHRSKYCSDGCSERMHHHNPCAPLSADNPNIVGAWLEPKELRRRNKELAKYGRRICRTHQEAALPLDEEHFYYHNRSEGRFETECRTCQNKRSAKNHTKSYWADPQERAYQMRQSKTKYRRFLLRRFAQIMNAENKERAS